MKNPFVIAFASALITAGALRAAPALAETPLEQRRDLRQLREDGRSRPRQRRRPAHARPPVAQAAREVCGTPSDVDLVGQNKARECRADAVAKASFERDAVLAAAKRGAVIAITASR